MLVCKAYCAQYFTDLCALSAEAQKNKDIRLAMQIILFAREMTWGDMDLTTLFVPEVDKIMRFCEQLRQHNPRL
jgi:hypothetical protein